jgi:hypothetical protein
MSTPDKAAIRAHVESRWREPRSGGLSLAAAFSDAFTAAMAAADGLWAIDEFRPSEQARYDGLLSAACTEVQRTAEGMLLDAMVDALVGFRRSTPGRRGPAEPNAGVLGR